MNHKILQKPLLKFLIPSVLGVFIFLLPVPFEGSITIPIGIITNQLSSFIEPFSTTIVLMFISFSAIATTITFFFRPQFILGNPRLAPLFVASPLYMLLRVVGAIITAMVYFQIGPIWIISTDTGGTMISLVKVIISWFFVASFLIPLLTDFGIMDYVGTLVKNFTYPLFKLPGRATVDLLASWLGSNTVGVVITAAQYEQGYYTIREGITIATCFSAVSMPFCMVISAMINVEHLFIPFYAIICITGIITAIIMARIPPLSTCSNKYYQTTGKVINENVPKEYSRFQWALKLAIEKAATGPSLCQIVNKGIDMFFSIIFQSSPIVVAVGTLACIIATYTPLFDWLSLPFAYLLQFLNVEDAFTAAPALIIGFVDMFLPAVLAAGITSLKTRFIIGIISLVQIVYITEIGTVLLTSKLPVNFRMLAIIFLERTLIALPIVVLLTNLLGIS
ncbi:nucleoside recognition membrane protein YjiH [Enterococcus sp. PF1-24]|uniref:YjiH family protein n=1 Tax=unclassified Enterococcus TaxID=2608891 RepID=UPI0024734463|nr:MULTISPECIES: YjiH family protein [unclassified Enterococcus]MDH6363488.1 nucleoside recognition membrane protein YjiH [Enterococcus sp. PFB1-1]MDH6400582.1 nucleoside recognition membrane protein YjiH [Enterococcus sp. PF1-24]